MDRDKDRTFRLTRRSRLPLLGGLLIFSVAVPTALSALTGSGQLNDVVNLAVSTSSISASDLTSSGTPAASSTAFAVTNSNSNVDTFIRYGWSTTPYYGSTTSDTSITLRGTTHTISDLLFFKQQTVDGASVTLTSDSYSPLILKNSATISRATWTSDGAACTLWTGTPAVGFLPTAGGSFTFKYYPATSQTDDTPATSDTFYYCLDTTNSLVYLGTSRAYASGTMIKSYTSNSAAGVLNTYQYEFLTTGQSFGNKYCMTGFTGSGTSATPDLAMCQKMPYSASGSSTAKMYPLFDPPAYFPSGNQGGGSAALTYAISGTQWNPYAYSTTNSA